MLTDERRCDQCGTEFTPRREHSRFCTARCRVIWNREHAGDMHLRADALEWSVAAMWQATERLSLAPRCDRDDGFTIIGEAVWWVTMVDATLVRYQADAYTDLLASLSEGEREVTEDTFGGLRFVRNRMAYDGVAGFVRPALPGSGNRQGTSYSDGTVASWTWLPVPEPVAPALTDRGHQWEMARYHSYRAQLAGRPVGQTFDRATAFLRGAWEPSQLRQL